jgi:type VI secretion system protein ImpG
MGRDQALEPFFGTPGRDADVERLLESFSFLAGRLREKLDDELPEITHGLFGMLWPNYLRPLPAASVIQSQLHNNATNTSFIPRGTLVESTAVGGTACRFQTVYDTEVLPLAVVDQRMIERHGTAIMAVRFAITGGGLRGLPLSRLRVFFTGEKEESIPYTLYLNLVYRLREVRFVIREATPDGVREHVTATLPPSCIRPLGFQEDEGLYPYPKETALGYRILEEFFCYPEKFLFVEIAGLEQGLSKETLARFADTKEFELHFVLPAIPERYETFQAASWNLSCTPVVNIFPFETARQKVTPGQSEDKIVPDKNHPDALAVYSVEGISDWEQEGRSNALSTQEKINPFAYMTQSKGKIRYRVDIRPTLDREHMETYIRVDSPAHADFAIKLQLLCTNGSLPKRLSVGDICVSAGSAGAAAVPFRNILPVSTPHAPPCSDDTLWQLLSNMRLNYIPLTDIAAFRSVIATYAFRAAADRIGAKRINKLLHGIRAITSPTTDRIFAGLPRRGARTTITMDQTFFHCEGAMYLFGSALNEFLSMYATVNSFHQLIVKEASRGEEYHWPARLGSLIRQ